MANEKWIRVKSFYAGSEGIYIQDEIRFVSDETLKKLGKDFKYKVVNSPTPFELPVPKKEVKQNEAGKKNTTGGKKSKSKRKGPADSNGQAVSSEAAK